MKSLRTFFCLFLLALVLAGIVGCNTVEGVGKDIEKGGEKIQNVVK